MVPVVEEFAGNNETFAIGVVFNVTDGPEPLPVSPWLLLNRQRSDAILQRCTDIATQLRKIRPTAQSSPSVGQTLAAFYALHGLSLPLAETLDGINARPENFRSVDDQDEMIIARGSILGCMVRALQEVRSLAVSLPRSDKLVRAALRCSPDMLSDLETFVFREAEKDGDSGVLFAQGLYWSEMNVFGHDAPFFTASTEPKWVKDEQGLYVQEHIVRSEEYLRRAEEASTGQQRIDRGAMRALRLYQHAKSLATQHHDAAAEWRYLAASEVAANHDRQKLAAHTLTRLSYFYTLRGNTERALHFAQRALRHEADPLAIYLDGALRRSRGHLRTETEVLKVAESFRSVAGRLPSTGLEQERADAHEELLLLGAAAQGGVQDCFKLHDAARLLICTFCKLLFRSRALNQAAVLSMHNLAYPSSERIHVVEEDDEDDGHEDPMS